MTLQVQLSSKINAKVLSLYGHCQILIHPMALSKQMLWSLSGPWEHLLLHIFMSNYPGVALLCEVAVRESVWQVLHVIVKNKFDTDNVFQKVKYRVL